MRLRATPPPATTRPSATKHSNSYTTGNNNTATGFAALQNTTGVSNGNTAVGVGALQSNTIASNNTAIGFDALQNNTFGQNNIALGVGAGNNITLGSDNIEIGNGAVGGDESNTIRIGRGDTQVEAFIAGIRERTTGHADAIPVLIDSSGQLGTVSSSRRFKKEIKPMDQTSQAILGLKPVTFQYQERPQRHGAIWFDCRGGGPGGPEPGGA